MQNDLLAQVHQRIVQVNRIVQKYHEALQIAQKARQEIAAKSYFYAIKSLKTIRTEFLSVPPLVTLKFTDKFVIWIRETMKDIQEASYQAFVSWLKKTDEESLEKIGSFVIGSTNQKIHSNGRETGAMSGTIHPLDWILEEAGAERSAEQDDFDTLANKINFSIIFETLYAHSLLDQRDFFIKSYLELRRAKFQTLIDEFRADPTNNVLEHFDKSLTCIAGYFVFESLIITNSQSSFSKSSIESQWISFLALFYEKCQRIIETVLPQLADYSFEEPFVSFKNTCNSFVRGMISYQYKFEGISSLFADLLQKFITVQRKYYEKQAFSILQSKQLREQSKIPDSSQLEHYSFLISLIKSLQLPSLSKQNIKLVKNAAKFPYEFYFSSCTLNIFELLAEFSGKLKTFSSQLPQDNQQLNLLALKAMENFIAENIASPIASLGQDKKTDFEFVKTLLHTIDALAYPIRDEIEIFLIGTDNVQSKSNFLHSQSASLQRILLTRLQSSLLDLFPIKPDDSKNFFEYLHSIYREKLSDVASEVKNLLFWNILNFVNQQLTDAFYVDTSKGPLEGLGSPVIQHYQNLLVQMRSFFEEHFPSNPNEYETLFASLRQPLDCIESSAYYDLTTIAGRTERFGLINMRKFIQTLEALRISNWASKTPFAGNPKMTLKSVLEDVVKKIKAEFRF